MDPMDPKEALPHWAVVILAILAILVAAHINQLQITCQSSRCMIMLSQVSNAAMVVPYELT